jgi:hypothetical protein
MNTQNIEKKLYNIGYYLTKYNDSYTLSRFNNGEVILDFFCDSEEDLQEDLIKDLKYHLLQIENEDKNYFEGCDPEYLKTEWKTELENILSKIH